MTKRTKKKVPDEAHRKNKQVRPEDPVEMSAEAQLSSVQRRERALAAYLDNREIEQVEQENSQDLVLF